VEKKFIRSNLTWGKRGVGSDGKNSDHFLLNRWVNKAGSLWRSRKGGSQLWGGGGGQREGQKGSPGVLSNDIKGVKNDSEGPGILTGGREPLLVEEKI